MRLPRFLPVLALSLAAALPTAAGALAAPSGQAAPSEATAPVVQTATTARAATLESSIVRELNRVRAENGLKPVTVSPLLAAAAVGHSLSMISSGVFDHTSVDGTTFDKRVLRSYPTRGFAEWTVGENLLFDATEIDATAAVRAWMASPGHRANMLNRDFREVGVGALFATLAPGDFGGGPALVITLDFGARTPAKASHKPVRLTAGH